MDYIKIYANFLKKKLSPQKKLKVVFDCSNGTTGPILQKLKDGAEFGQLARQYSKDPSKERGGDIGYFAKGQLMPEIEEACFKLEVGQVSDIIKTQLGYHIMKLTDKKEPHAVELSEVKGTIEKELKDKAQQESFDALVKSLKSKARVKINEKLLEDEVK